ncbi:cytochrome c oxidase assembly protein [Hyphomicrobium sp. D-2]|uniref:cytochrome c oxidase assembly protein n=1 Tax=Hyphomicrobium sp. D-2 TaxID=3041621 RepID=UPI00245571CA|nr:cytochrome c oxidase assembly protein [Hyphomicrobium sp. D-2]MDH4982180.1 cytochrome c oxidase assembly protein [Hyphomicrobium sp. D-2]
MKALVWHGKQDIRCDTMHGARMSPHHASVPRYQELLLKFVEASALSFTVLAAALFGASAVASQLGLGLLSRHMIEHMAVLGIAAPLCAYALQSISIAWSGARFVLAVICQIALLWIWHLPPVFSSASDSLLLHAVMGVSLYIAGVLFWSAVFSSTKANRWQSVMALLITGKLFCMFAVILVFSPRLLYDLAAHTHHSQAMGGIEDQQFAGLIMITVCPLTYVATGIVMAARWLLALEESDRHMAETAFDMRC